MKQKFFLPKKYCFTQWTGALVGLFSPIVVILIIKWFKPDIGIEKNLFHLFIGIAFLLATTLVPMYLRGRFLVLIGVLTKDEAKGYPYAKPWEAKRLE